MPSPITTPLPTSSDLELGDWIRAEIGDNVTIDDDGWAVELVRRVANRVQRDEPEDARLIPVVTWSREATAFTAPGRYVYFSRSLLELPMPEDAVALAFAHELAHHRLGHLALFRRGMTWLPRVPGAPLVAVLVRLAERKLSSPENEGAADRWALERCLAAGYDGRRCLQLFRVLEKYALDHRDVSGVFGEDVEEWVAETELRRAHGLPPPREGAARWGAKAGAWLVQRLRGYAPLRARRDALRQVLGIAR